MAHTQGPFIVVLSSSSAHAGDACCLHPPTETCPYACLPKHMSMQISCNGTVSMSSAALPCFVRPHSQLNIHTISRSITANRLTCRSKAVELTWALARPMPAVTSGLSWPKAPALSRIALCSRTLASSRSARALWLGPCDCKNRQHVRCTRCCIGRGGRGVSMDSSRLCAGLAGSLRGNSGWGRANAFAGSGGQLMNRCVATSGRSMNLPAGSM